MVKSVIEMEQVSLVYPAADKPVEAIHQIDLSIEKGEFVSIIGPSGCGKTSLLRLIADLEKPSTGSLTVNGLSAAEARQARAYGYVFQSPSLFPWRTVKQNIALPLQIAGYDTAVQNKRSEETLALVGLSEFAKKYPWQLSGGMQQRVSIARALAFDAEILLMDEPFGALDEMTREHLNDQLLDLWRRTGKTIVFVTHSISEAVYLSNRIAVMTPRPGQIAEVIASPLPSERNLDIRDTQAFVEVTHSVRKLLKSEGMKEDYRS